ncbi:RNA polymerase II transcription factor SIII subunit A-domain-containing protein [Coprinopsis sp. MPI-PUGE-AT-0042]|nr:RNA polymerase II transcription factor SIII subunit A-domain-containing protein [Coprinopsis sp. MPI-PUGE-AT-0042]
MNSAQGHINNRVPSLVLLCQRVAGNQTDLLSSLGELRFDLVKPILEKCDVEQLQRLEVASPHLQSGTPDIWMDLCFRKYRRLAEDNGYNQDEDPDEPDSWKERYFHLERAEARRIEEIGSKIRSQRLEAEEERKKEREVKFTDRLPPPKRSRTGGWGMPTQPKTLFDKARGEASKIQKALYTSRVVPPTGKTARVLAKPNDAILPPVPNSTSTRVTVTVHRRIRPPTSRSLSTASAPSSSAVTTSSSSQMTTPACSPPAMSSLSSSRGLPPTGSIPELPRSVKEEITKVPPKPPNVISTQSSPTHPLASLFVPKHRAHSQRPVR